MNIIFLDVDGVLNSTRSLMEAYYKNRRPYSGYDYPFDSKCLENLKYLVKKTDAYLVITSTWRKTEKGKEVLLNELEKYNLVDRVIGYTEVLNTKRGEEVKQYLSQFNEGTNYIILDDDSDFDDLEDHLIKTDYHIGLTIEQTHEGIKKLIKRI